MFDIITFQSMLTFQVNWSLGLHIWLTYIKSPKNKQNKDIYEQPDIPKSLR